MISKLLGIVLLLVIGVIALDYINANHPVPVAPPSTNTQDVGLSYLGTTTEG